VVVQWIERERMDTREFGPKIEGIPEHKQNGPRKVAIALIGIAARVLFVNYTAIK